MNNTYLTEAKHPKTGEVYKLGDTVCIYQGRFGHNNIMTIRTIISYPTISNGEKEIEISISDEEISEENINNSECTKGSFTGLYAVKEKLSEKRMKEIQRAKQLARQYS